MNVECLQLWSTFKSTNASSLPYETCAAGSIPCVINTVNSNRTWFWYIFFNNWHQIVLVSNNEAKSIDLPLDKRVKNEKIILTLDFQAMLALLVYMNLCSYSCCSACASRVHDLSVLVLIES